MKPRPPATAAGRAVFIYRAVFGLFFCATPNTAAAHVEVAGRGSGRQERVRSKWWKRFVFGPLSARLSSEPSTGKRSANRRVRNSAGARFFTPREKDNVMMDILYVALVLVFFGVAAAYVRACDRL